jgi:hypothetical protein
MKNQDTWTDLFFRLQGSLYSHGQTRRDWPLGDVYWFCIFLALAVAVGAIQLYQEVQYPHGPLVDTGLTLETFDPTGSETPLLVEDSSGLDNPLWVEVMRWRTVRSWMIVVAVGIGIASVFKVVAIVKFRRIITDKFAVLHYLDDRLRREMEEGGALVTAQNDVGGGGSLGSEVVTDYILRPKAWLLANLGRVDEGVDTLDLALGMDLELSDNEEEREISRRKCAEEVTQMRSKPWLIASLRDYRSWQN